MHGGLPDLYVPQTKLTNTPCRKRVKVGLFDIQYHYVSYIYRPLPGIITLTLDFINNVEKFTLNIHLCCTRLIENAVFG